MTPNAFGSRAARRFAGILVPLILVATSSVAPARTTDLPAPDDATIAGPVLITNGLFGPPEHSQGDEKGKKKKDRDRDDDSGNAEEGSGEGNGGSGEGTGGSGEGTGGSGGTEPDPCWTWGDAEKEFAVKINEARDRRDISKLTLDPELSKVAQYHSWEMVSEQQLHHTPEEKLRVRVTNWQLLGENVGVGGSVDSLHEAFMESDDHRAIVLHRDFNYFGVGVHRDDADRIWVTVLFEAYEDPGTTMEMPPGCRTV